MSKLTLEEAISHCLEVAEQNETQAEKIGRQFIGSAMDKRATDYRECAADHRQFAEWLTELKELKNSIGAVKLKDMKEAVGLLQELNAENNQLTSQLLEAKSLLGKALRTLNDSSCNKDCRQCKWNENGCEMSCRFAWRYGDEVSALIGDGNDAE